MNFVKSSALAALFASSLAFAADNTTPPEAPAAPAHKGHAAMKAARKQAREECLAGNATLKGKALHNCIKGKLKK